MLNGLSLTSGCFPILNTLSQVVFPWRQQLDKAANLDTQHSPKRGLTHNLNTQEAWKPTIYNKLNPRSLDYRNCEISLFRFLFYEIETALRRGSLRPGELVAQYYV